MTDLKTLAIRKLAKRRGELQAAYDELVSQPASYSISGSVSATNQKLSELRAEIDAIDAKIGALSGGGGIRREYPNYNNPGY